MVSAFTVAGPVFVVATSAVAITAVFTIAAGLVLLLLAGTGSVVVLVLYAMFRSVSGTAGLAGAVQVTT